MACGYVIKEIVKLKGRAQLRDGFVTDNGNIIIDVYDWVINDPVKLECQLNSIPGVVDNGLFALRNADQIIIGRSDSVEILS